MRKTTLIKVTYRSSDPSQAATVLNCLAGAYVARHARFDRPPGESDSLEQQVVESRSRLEQAQWVEFSRDRGAVAATGRQDIVPRLSRATYPLGDRAIQQDELLNTLSAADSETAIMGRLKDGVARVIEAHRTRRVKAQKAKEILQAANVKVLGTVLSGRTFPIPEAIYRNL